MANQEIVISGIGLRLVKNRPITNPTLHKWLEQRDQNTRLSDFDANFFGVHIKQARLMDPQSRWLLEVSYEAILDTGINVEHLRGSNICVLVSGTNTDAHGYYSTQEKYWNTGYQVTGCCPAMFANRISHTYDFRGLSCNITSSCPTSIVTTLFYATNLIRRGHCTAALIAVCDLYHGVGVFYMCPSDKARRIYGYVSAAHVRNPLQFPGNSCFHDFLHVITNILASPSTPTLTVTSKDVEILPCSRKSAPETLHLTLPQGPVIITSAGLTESGLVDVLSYCRSSINHDAECDKDFICQQTLLSYLWLMQQSHMDRKFMFRGYTILEPGKNNTIIEVSPSQPETPVLCYMFGGMGSQWLGMAQNMMDIPSFAQSIRTSSQYMSEIGVDLITLLTGTSDELESSNKRSVTLGPVTTSFISIISIQLALVDTLSHMGLSPCKVVGHSIGELTCAHLDGHLTHRQVLLAAYHRGRCVDTYVTSGVGCMAVIGCGEEDLSTLLSHVDDVVVSCYNTTDNLTISGLVEDVSEVVRRGEERNMFTRLLDTHDIAFHHPRLLTPAVQPLKRALDKLDIPSTPISTLWVPTCQAGYKKNGGGDDTAMFSADYLISNFSEPVLFHRACESIINGDKDVILLDVSPHPILSTLVKRMSDTGGPLVLPLMKRNKPSENPTLFFETLGKCYLHGLPLDTSSLLHPLTSIERFVVEDPNVCVTSHFTWRHDTQYEVPFVSQQPISDQPISDQPINEQPIREQPISDQPISDQPISEQPISEQPISEQPISEQPISEQPISEQPISEQLDDEEPIHEQLGDEGSDVVQALDSCLGASVEDIQDEGEMGISMKQVIGLGDDFTEDLYADHVIDGRILMPLFGYIWLPWKLMAQQMKTHPLELCLTFTNITIHRPTILKDGAHVELQVTLHSSGRICSYFEVTDGTELCASGYIQQSKSGVTPSSHGSSLFKLSLSSPDIYKILSRRGYEYGSRFKHILAANLDGSEGMLAWQGDWVPYLDAFLQMSILAQHNKHLYLPVGINRLDVDCSTHYEYLENNGKILPCTWDYSKNICEGIGVTMQGVEVAIAPRKNIRKIGLGSDVLLHHYTFIPYDYKISPHYSSVFREEDDINMLTDICVENLAAIPTHILISEADDLVDEEDSVLEMMMKRISIHPLIKANILSIGDGTNLTQLIHILILHRRPHLTTNTTLPLFVIIRTSEIVSLNSESVWENYVLVAQTNTWLLYKKCGEGTQHQVRTVIPISVLSSVMLLDDCNERYFKWVYDLQEALASECAADSIWLLSDKDRFSGVVGLVNSLQREPMRRKIRCVVSDEVIDTEEMDEIFAKDLVMNVREGGVWGSYRMIKWNVVPDGGTGNYNECNEVLLGQQKKGDISSLVWCEIMKCDEPTHDQHQEEEDKLPWVEVVYAALNFRDVMIATGTLPMDALPSTVSSNPFPLGMEYSGYLHHPTSPNTPPQPVMGVLPCSALASRFILPPDSTLIWTVPSHLTLAQAATIPVAYCTSYLALHVLRPDLATISTTASTTPPNTISTTPPTAISTTSPITSPATTSTTPPNTISTTPPNTIYTTPTTAISTTSPTTSTTLPTASTTPPNTISTTSPTTSPTTTSTTTSTTSTTSLTTSTTSPTTSTTSLTTSTTSPTTSTTSPTTSTTSPTTSTTSPITSTTSTKSTSILIHSASGGVGLAAVKLAINLDYHVFATVGSNSKKVFLLSTHPHVRSEDVFSSRDDHFYLDILYATNGRGVDIILNSLSGTRLQAGLRCMAANGCFLEIGKMDAMSHTRISLDHLCNGVSIQGVMLDQVNDASTLHLLHTLLDDGVRCGGVTPLPHTIYTRYEVKEAFKLMARGKHMGKVIIQMKEDPGYCKQTLYTTTNPTNMTATNPTNMSAPNPTNLSAPNPTPPTFRVHFNASALHIITGGLGGLGLELVNWMVDRGAKHFILISRSGVTSGYQRYKLSKWRENGEDVRVECVDLADSSKLINLLTKLSHISTISSIFHLAGVINDSLFPSQTPKSFVTAHEGKVCGCLTLDSFVRQHVPHLCWFVTFSSMSAVVGNVGQTNYSHANHIMERIVMQRHRDGLAGKCIQWGAIRGVGMLDGWSGDVVGGTTPLTLHEYLDHLDTLLSHQMPIVSCYKPYTSGMRAEEGVRASPGGLLSAIRRILGFSSNVDIPEGSTFSQLGMDSLMSAEMRQVLDDDYNTRFPTTDTLMKMTLAQLLQTINSHTK